MKKPSTTAPFTADRRPADVTTPLMEAARAGAYERVLECLDRGCDINAVDDAGRNALFYALDAKQETIATVLLNRGIDGAQAAKDGVTPLMRACANEIPEIVQRLLQKKVPLDARTEHGNTALIFACAAGDGWSACRLLEEGADWSPVNAQGNSAVSLARVGMSNRDFLLFEQCLLQKMEARRLALAVQKEQELARQVEEATILQRDVRPLKPVAFRPKAL